MSGIGKGWVIGSIFVILVIFFLGFALAWINIERVDAAYSLKKLEEKIMDKRSLIAKLEVERNGLVSPYRLRTLAEEYGLYPAKPGQIRRLEAK